MKWKETLPALRRGEWTLTSLFNVSRRVASWLPVGPHDRWRAEDVTQDLLLRLTKLPSSRFEDLCSKPEPEIEGYLKKAARAVAADSDPRNAARRAIRRLVTQILAERKRLVASGPAPLSIRVGGRFSKRSIRSAMAHLAHEVPQSAGVVAYTSALLVRYAHEVDPVAGFPASNASNTETLVDEMIDATRLVEEALARVHPEERRVLAASVTLCSIRAVAHELGLRTTYAHTRLRHAVVAMAAAVPWSEFSASTHAAAREVLQVRLRSEYRRE